MYIPEWEIEESLARNPFLLEISGRLEELELIERQKYLKEMGGYIDLLFKKGRTYVIVEIKSTLIDDESVVINQLLRYKQGLSSELRIPESDIVGVLATPMGFSADVRSLCDKLGVIPRQLDQKELVKSIRHPRTKKELSIKRLLEKGVQDELAKREIASLFKKVSATAPIRAHEVGTSTNGKLTSNYDMWFWMFYSVMDRRANAVTFVNAKKALEEERLFHPYEIVRLVADKGERKALNKIAGILEDHGFPLLKDRVMGKLSFPKSIVDAAQFMTHYEFSFDKLYHHYIDASQGNLAKARDSLWNDIKNKIYGAGPRIASQFIRGMVLKGPWDFPLEDDRFLEKCRFNVRFAGKTRLGLLEAEDKYYEQLGKFADDYLDGNRGIVAHVLWYVRKRYCNYPPKCDECPISSYCIRACATAK